MTVKELIQELQQYSPDLQVVRVVDFENTDEYGNCIVENIENIMTQTYFDNQFGNNDETVVMLY